MHLHEYLDSHARQRPDAEFAVCGGRRQTWRQARDDAHRIARGLQACGLRPGDRMAVLARNSLETVLLYHGAFKAGVVPVPINARLKPSEWARQFRHAEARLLVADGHFTAAVEDIRRDLDGARSFIALSDEPIPGWTDFDDWRAAHDPRAPEVAPGERDAALQLYTSGTTGAPRAAVLSHRAVTANVAQLGGVCRLPPGRRFLLAIPLFHAAGIITMLHALACGAALLILPGFDAHQVVRALDEDRVAAAMLVPTMLHACLNEVPGVAQRRYEDLQLIVYGASPIDEQTARRAMQVFGCDFAQRYGTTETLSLAWLDPADHRRALEDRRELLHSAGTPLPGTEVRVVDERGRDVPGGQRGEFVVRGPQVMAGDESGSAANTLHGGWMRTGDAGYLDAEGYLYLCDRVKDVIISGGENIYPHEVESVLASHPAVGEAAVIGVPDAKWGEAVWAIVALRPDAEATAEQLIEHCRGHLAGFQVPRGVDFATTLPRNPAGKVPKRVLREPYRQGQRRPI